MSESHFAFVGPSGQTPLSETPTAFLISWFCNSWTRLTIPGDGTAQSAVIEELCRRGAQDAMLEAMP